MINPKQEKRLRRLKEFIIDKDKAIFNSILELDDTIDNVKKDISDISEDVEAAVYEKGDQGEKGENGQNGEQGNQGDKGDQGENGIDGKDGENGKDGEKGEDGIDGENGKDGSPDLAEDIRNKLESLLEDDRLDYTAIKGLEELLKKNGAKGVKLVGGTNGIMLYVNGVKQSITKYLDIVAGSNITITPTIVNGKRIVTINANSGIGGGVSGGTKDSILFINPDNTLAQDNQNFNYDSNTKTQYIASAISSELLTNGSFTGNATGWTLGTGWDYASNTVSKTSNGTATLFQNLTPQMGVVYVLTYTISNYTAGNIIPTFGGVNLQTRSANGTYTERIVAISGAGFNFYPSNTARFTIDNVSLKSLSGGNLAIGGTLTTGKRVSVTSNNDFFNTLNPVELYKTTGSYMIKQYMTNNTLVSSEAFDQSGNYLQVSANQQYYIGNPNSFFPSYTNGYYGLQHYAKMSAANGIGAGNGAGVASLTSMIQNGGNLALKVDRVTTNTTLYANSQHSQLLLDGDNASSCLGSPTYACSHWTNSTTCASNESHGGCSWTTINCSDYSRTDEGTCTSASPACSWGSVSCAGPTDSTLCTNQNNSYGGSCGFVTCSSYSSDSGTCSGAGCTWNYIDCHTWDNTDSETCSDHSGCSWSDAPYDCSDFNGNESGCNSTSGCTPTMSECSTLSDGGGDGTTCATQPECGYDTMTGICSGSYFSGCTGTYGGSCSGQTDTSCTGDYCSGTYNTGNCSGTGGNCVGSSTCIGLDNSTNCGAEAGCSWLNGLSLHLPDGETCPDRTWWFKNDSLGGSDVTIYPYSGQTINGDPSLVLPNYKDSIQLAYYKKTSDCTTINDSTTCGATSGCNTNTATCVWDSGGGTCSGNAICIGIGDQGTCESTSHFVSCTGTHIISKDWHMMSDRRDDLVAKVNAINQSASYSNTIYTTPQFNGDGFYSIFWNAEITRAASTSSVLGGATGFQAQYTSNVDGISKTDTPVTVVKSTTNTTGTSISGVIDVYVKTNTTIAGLLGYTSVGGTTMQYDLNIIVKKIA